MKKILFEFIFLFSFFCFAHSGLGGRAGYNFEEEPSSFFSVSFRSDYSPWEYSVEYDAENQRFRVVADNWFVYKPLGVVDYFCFWGISCSVKTESDEYISTGARAGCGLSAFVPGRHVEIFGSICWNPYLGWKFDNDFLLKPLSFPCSGGIRFWI